MCSQPFNLTDMRFSLKEFYVKNMSFFALLFTSLLFFDDQAYFLLGAIIVILVQEIAEAESKWTCY
jgi:hypothetical protein